MWDILRENWWLGFVLLAYVASALGNVFQRAVQNASKDQERAARRRVAGPEARQAPSQHEADTGPDVAAEIRRIMGVELEPQPFVPKSPEPEPEPVEITPDARVSADGLSHGGDLAARLAREDAVREQRFHNSITDRAKDLGSSIRDRYAATDADSLAFDAPRGKRRTRRVLSFDASRMVEAVIAAEVLGRPRALRPYGSESSFG